jgi:hypothetical protein
MEELSETPNLSRVLEFRNPDEGDQMFFVEEITGPTTTTTVVRVIDEEDEYVRLLMLLDRRLGCSLRSGSRLPNSRDTGRVGRTAGRGSIHVSFP